MAELRTKFIGSKFSSPELEQSIKAFPGAELASIIDVTDFGFKYYRTIVYFKSDEDRLAYVIKYGNLYT